MSAGALEQGHVMNRRNIIILLLLTATIAAFSACSAEKPQTSQAKENVRHVPVLSVQKSNVPDLLEAVGTVRSDQTSVLASQMMGNILEIRAHEGDRVQRGAVLAVIDDSQPRAAMERARAAENAAKEELLAAESDLGLATTSLRRYQTLYEKGTISAQEFDQVKARQQAALAHRDWAQAELDQTKAAVAQAVTTLQYSQIRAPFDGIVTEKKADPGSLVSPGTPIFTLEDTRRYRLEVSVNESDLASVQIGRAAPVFVDALGNAEWKGKVVQIVPAADPGSRAFLVKIELPGDPRLYSGLYGRAQFRRGERQSLLIPRTALVERGQLHGVFVLDQNRVANLHYVTLGKLSGEEVEVLAGLQGGERLVAAPGDRELDGQQIEAEP